MSTEQIARQILAANGCTEPHPALLDDTMREVEYHAEQAAGDELAAHECSGPRCCGIVSDTGFAAYEVVRDEFPVPCSHPSCALVHKRFHEGSEWSWEVAELPNGEQRRVHVQGTHEVMRTQWLVLRNGERADDAEPQDTRRAALVELARVRGM